MFQIQVETQKLQLRFSVRSQVPQSIKTDEKKLRVCLINLLGVRLHQPTQFNLLGKAAELHCVRAWKMISSQEKQKLLITKTLRINI